MGFGPFVFSFKGPAGEQKAVFPEEIGKVQEPVHLGHRPLHAKGEVEARQLMQISWSGDHRIIDGGTIARFTNLWKQYLEQPTSMLVNMI